MPARTRLIVVAVVTDDGERLLLCRMAPDRGVFPGQWALPGGGVEPGERIESAVRREIREELGIELSAAVPILFKDDVLEKTFVDGRREAIHMVFLVYRCRPASRNIVLNDEFTEFVWADRAELAALELNPLTRSTLASAGLLAPAREGEGIPSA
jgi:nucleoside triphosphatase